MLSDVETTGWWVLCRYCWYTKGNVDQHKKQECLKDAKSKEKFPIIKGKMCLLGS